jgi:hypothetical protein
MDVALHHIRRRAFCDPTQDRELGVVEFDVRAGHRALASARNGVAPGQEPYLLALDASSDRCDPSVRMFMAVATHKPGVAKKRLRERAA